MSRRVGSVWLVLLAIGAVAGCGEDEEEKDRFAEIPKRTVKAPPNETAPRWEQIAAFTGQRSTTRTVEVSRRAIQWRVRWRCQSGRLAVALTPAPTAGRRRAEGRCPGSGRAIWASSGRQQLGVQASAPWRLVVEEELRTPLHEPPLRAMRGLRPLARGKFRRIEVNGSGTASLYRLPGGRLAVRIERFRTEPNPSLVVWVSEARNPKTTKEAFNAPHTELGGLKSTIGDQNYLVARRLDADRVRSIIVWNKPSRIAYAVAGLTP